MLAMSLCPVVLLPGGIFGVHPWMVAVPGRLTTPRVWRKPRGARPSMKLLPPASPHFLGFFCLLKTKGYFLNAFLLGRNLTSVENLDSSPLKVGITISLILHLLLDLISEIRCLPGTPFQVAFAMSWALLTYLRGLVERRRTIPTRNKLLCLEATITLWPNVFFPVWFVLYQSVWIKFTVNINCEECFLESPAICTSSFWMAKKTAPPRKKDKRIRECGHFLMPDLRANVPKLRWNQTAKPAD